MHNSVGLEISLANSDVRAGRLGAALADSHVFARLSALQVESPDATNPCLCFGYCKFSTARFGVWIGHTRNIE
jgi:hypothetical protein